MEVAVVTLILSVIGLIVFIAVMVKHFCEMSEIKQKEEDLAVVWSKLNNHLANQNFNISSEMEVVRKSDSKEKILNLHIAIDMENKMFLFTKVVENELLELVSETLAFDTICGGELLVGGRSSSSNSFGTGVGQNTQFGSTIATGSAFSTTTNYVNSIEYKIKTTDMINPIYNVVICDIATNEASDTYKHYMDVSIRLDTIIKQIVAENNK